MKIQYQFLLLCWCMVIAQHPARTSIDLSGKWEMALDPNNTGTAQKWFAHTLEDTVLFPGTLDSNQKGTRNKDTTLLHLNRLYMYEGIAWYRKKITIPNNFRDKHIELFLERTKSSKIWIDGNPVGSSRLLESPQTFDVSAYLTPGEHYICIRINNDLKLTPYGNVHIYSDDTQTNWNGIIGKIALEASAKNHITNLQVYPDVENQKIDIELSVNKKPKDKTISVELYLEKTHNGKTVKLNPKKVTVPNSDIIKLDYTFTGSDLDLWDEFNQPMYQLKVVLPDYPDDKTVSFGMRSFKADGTKFTVNGRTAFLRGKHEAAVFPITGYTPTDVADWVKVYRIAKSYGINHYRFHSYCPPEAAFTAADQEGIYIQVELPFWGGMETDSVATMQKEEAFALLKAYGNHPSFVLFSPGNEIWSGHDNVEKNMVAIKAFDRRHLYAIGSNNNIGYTEPRSYADFFIGARTPYDGDSQSAHTRLTHAFADADQGGILNTRIPSTDRTFDYAVSRLKIPLISHEIGQYQIYPDYSEITKYTGVLKPWNLETFRSKLKKAGMLDQAGAFQKASGAWAALCYKAEMETAIRTKNLAGFQLLDLQDFPGQGTALIGVLDAFMASKNVISPENWRQSCDAIVLLLEFPKYCYTSGEEFRSKLVVANYSAQNINKTVRWEIKRADGSVFRQGFFPSAEIKNDGLSGLGEITADLSSITKPEKLTVSVSFGQTDISNTYSIWVYPKPTTVRIPKGISIAEKLDQLTLKKLAQGEKVLLFPKTADVAKNSFAGHFPPEFWNYGMFKSISESNKKPVSSGTLGLLMDPSHPVFNSFPTDSHTDWNWFSIVKASNSLMLDETENSYRPIIQVIDNLERNHKLGLVFEFRVGKGKLLVCMSRLPDLPQVPEATQLYRSLLDYMESGKFNPTYQISPEKLSLVFGH
ncbi:sugar-binding domain-containing protein [Flavobacterium silvaticum]|uniref:Beta-galactosidase n=1 Tax=Flavobacterium silvaticum TaxID=1852020 RepID=A0A972FKH4_9FLAO|nr:sugar-binding domain-containing protein [Flavobacterium silvaticum]NMH27423.1 beta-galactosidase [Flavobacterium silvaticum]